MLKSAEPGSFAAAGETIHYSFLVTNTGNVTLTGVQVVDTDLPGLSAIDCPDATLAAGASQTCTASYTTTAGDVDAGSVTNAATAQGDRPGSTTPVMSGPSTATVPVIGAPAITVVKSARPRTFSGPGMVIHYSFVVTNNGNVTLTNVQVNDTDLPGLSPISCPSTTLAPGASQTCTAHYVTTAADVRARRVRNVATAQGDPPGSTTPVLSQPSTVTVRYVHRPRPPVPPTPTPVPPTPTPVPPTPTPVPPTPTVSPTPVPPTPTVSPSPVPPTPPVPPAPPGPVVPPKVPVTG